MKTTFKHVAFFLILAVTFLSKITHAVCFEQSQITSGEIYIDEVCYQSVLEISSANVTLETTANLKITSTFTLKSSALFVLLKKAIFTAGTTTLQSSSIYKQFGMSSSVLSGVTMNKATFNLYDNATSASTSDFYITNYSTLELFNFSVLMTSGQITTQLYGHVITHNSSQLITKSNLYVMIDGIMKVYDSSSISVSRVLRVHGGSLLLYETTQLIVEGNILTISSGKITQNDWSVVSAPIFYLQSTYTLNGNSVMNCSGVVYVDSSLTLNEKSLISAQIISVSSSGIIQLNSNNSIVSLVVTNLLCDSGTINIVGWNSIESENVTVPSCKVTVSPRSYVNVPLFVTKIIDLTSVTVTSSQNFIFAVAKKGDVLTVLGITSKFKLIQNNQILAYGGTPTSFYCHFSELKFSSANFVEPFCPCETETCYFAPISSVMEFDKIYSTFYNEANNYLTLKRVDKNEVKCDEVQNVIFLNNTKLSLTNVNTFEVKIEVFELVTFSFSTLTVPVLIHSVQAFSYKGMLCDYGLALGTQFTCLHRVSCSSGAFDSVNKTCVACHDPNCYRCENDNITNCIFCDKKSILRDGKCVVDDHCVLADGHGCLKCADGYENVYDGCIESDDYCQFRSVTNTEICAFCSPLQNVINENGKCVQLPSNASIFTPEHIVACSQGFFLHDTKCDLCDTLTESCVFCSSHCEKCDSGYSLLSNYTCKSEKCHTTETADVSGQCVTLISGCSSLSQEKCLLCSPDTYLWSDQICNISTNTVCDFHTTSGCYRCTGGYYLNDSNNCLPCDSECLTCSTTSLNCTSCPVGKYLSQNRCQSNDKLTKSCKTFSIFGNGCYECRDGYYRIGLSCEMCAIECGTCSNENSCITCNSTNFRTEEFECVPRSVIQGCANEVVHSGCTSCKSGYYIYKSNQCQACVDPCFTCESASRCTSCRSQYVLSSHLCVYFSNISGCLKAEDSKCARCSFWHKPSVNGVYCQKSAVWWVIVLFILFLLVIVTIVILVIILVIKLLLNRLRNKSVLGQMTIFKMSRSNIKFTEVVKGISVSKTTIDLNEDVPEFPVCEETRHLFCVGNSSSRVAKYQILKKSEEKIRFRVIPEVVTLRKGEACEFEIYITARYTCTIDSIFILFMKLYHSNKEKKISITLKGETLLSSRLDPNEIQEEKKLGEGGFGIVFLGHYRGNTVAVKRMKQSDGTKEAYNEFQLEVIMLEKFRSEYIVYFYGAVLVRKRLAIVTEYAPYGSLMDLMKKKREAPICEKMKRKIVYDGTKGIMYLHMNDILHRDIKPDNLLVVSLESNIAVNAKLTDFGSSRNINMLMTNMTFTKGIGTPVYMAPEILNKQKYKKPADIFSFAITMYECFGWQEAYPSTIFVYPWDIADFVNAGNRRPKLENMEQDMYDLIKKCWSEEPSDRITIESLRDALEPLLLV
ncbi:protein serine/threonine kinase, putative [Entamoeba invadens IP1]|uniref:Protein serine/threonine kinase, putative n=1 Tax=Entamoeba invadens IP1 TaxID=370355 RepID=A0A0A1U4E8_ENTIV|nr:protein serine/threonine kinase, putative [Entamoeba invadens IP1]ELP89040.1 protein serine/threonine kinase, putative [Entamoeba invadens IP1]|eukprot:XP_004255811.1 protein serine/threonine kinase, putative [Entamoeba invadens IP1]